MAKRKTVQPAPQNIVEATFVVSANQNRAIADQMETVMAQAIVQAHADGLTSPDHVRERILMAIAQAKATIADGNML